MCGIAGLIGTPDLLDEGTRVGAMLDALSRRGPDSSGLERWDGSVRGVLGHRRLAIFDLSPAGNQPFLSPDRSVGLVFNGAIYNFWSLRQELEARGRRFTSRTDTEVLLVGYQTWGIDELVRRIRGMFAFALWDEPRQRLFLVRDRLGVKPLIWAPFRGGIAFASTVRALRRAGIVDGIDGMAVAEFLEYGVVSDERTIYTGAHKVPAASILEWSPGQEPRIRAYWQPPAAASTPAQSWRDTVEQTGSLLLDATRKRLLADVPVGALLSGGIDSALVCWAIRESGADITAFTVGTPEDSVDETADAVATARELGIRHRVLPLADSEPITFDRLTTAYAEPFACSSALGMLRVSQAVAESSVKVLLTGDGGDDVFLGYPRHQYLLRIQRAARFLPSAAGPVWRAARRAIPQVGVLRRGVHLADYLTGGLGAFLSANDGLPWYRRHGLLGDRLRDRDVTARGIPWSVTAAREALTAYLDYDLHHQFVAEYLTKVDGATMHYALEARAPFFDQELWEFASALPYDTRLQGGVLKAVLRALAAERISPRVAVGRKRGFSIPVESWIAGRWRGAVEELLLDSEAQRQGWINAAPALRMLRATPSGTPASQQLWYLAVLESWLRKERDDVDHELSGGSSARIEEAATLGSATAS